MVFNHGFAETDRALMDTIFIQQLQVEAIIGVYPAEKIHKQPLSIDIEMQYDTCQAIASDNLKYALDYHQICQDIHAFVENSSFQLIESLADAIAQRILEKPAVAQVDVKLFKPNALDLAKNVGVRIIRNRELAS